MIESLAAAVAESQLLISARLKAALQDVLTRSDKVLAEDLAMYIGSVPEDCKKLWKEVEKLASELVVTTGPQKNPKAWTQCNRSAHSAGTKI